MSSNEAQELSVSVAKVANTFLSVAEKYSNSAASMIKLKFKIDVIAKNGFSSVEPIRDAQIETILNGLNEVGVGISALSDALDESKRHWNETDYLIYILLQSMSEK